MINQWNNDPESLKNVDLSPLIAPNEAKLMQRLSEFEEVVIDAGSELSPHVIANYLKDCAADLHSYYNDTKFLVDDEPTKLARLALISATKQVLKNGLDLLGVSAPLKM